MQADQKDRHSEGKQLNFGRPVLRTMGSSSIAPADSTAPLGQKLRRESTWLRDASRFALDTLKGEGRVYKKYFTRSMTSRTSFDTARQTAAIPEDMLISRPDIEPSANTPFDEEWLLMVQSRARSAGRRTGASVGVGLACIALLPLGPIIMLIGGACGLIVGFLIGFLFDLIHTRRTISHADKELRRLTHLVRFTIDQIDRQLFTQSASHGNAYCCHLLEAVVLEFKPYVEVGRLSPSILKKLNLFYSFLHQQNVYQCLWIYVNEFLAKWATSLTVSEFVGTCRNVLTTLVDVERTLNVEQKLEVISKVEQFLKDPKVSALDFAHWTPNEVALKNLEAVLVRDFYVPTSSGRKSSIDNLIARRNSGILREHTDEAYQDVEEEEAGDDLSPRSLPSTSLFKSFRDFINFDLGMKHKIPISDSEFRFLYEKEREPLEAPGWELAVERKNIKILKFVPQAEEGSTSVLVRAYATLPNISIANVFFNIFDPTRRQTWDTNFAQLQVLPRDEPDECEVLYCVLQSPFGVTPRDFLQYRKAQQSEKVLTILMRSAEHALRPLVPGCIRAESYISGYVIREVEGGCALFIMSQTDVKGLIPKWIVNMMAAKAPAQWVGNLLRSCTALVKQFGGSHEKMQIFLTEYVDKQVNGSSTTSSV